MPDLYIIAGCNGAGKTTASKTMLPEMLNCIQFVNADEIAAKLSPDNPEKVAVEAGRVMLKKISSLIKRKSTFAFETTLAARSYVSLIKNAKLSDYKITLIFFWLNSPQTAQDRVTERVENGGHDISPEIIKRRYQRGITNFFLLYKPVADYWIIGDNSDIAFQKIAAGEEGLVRDINKPDIWDTVLKQAIAFKA